MNKSNKYKYRIMTRNNQTNPYYVQRRRLGFGIVLGWKDVYRDLDYYEYLETFYSIEQAKEFIKERIKRDNYVKSKFESKQVWP